MCFSLIVSFPFLVFTHMHSFQKSVKSPLSQETSQMRQSLFFDQDEALVMWDTYALCLMIKRLLWWQSNFKVGFEKNLEDRRLWLIFSGKSLLTALHSDSSKNIKPQLSLVKSKHNYVKFQIATESSLKSSFIFFLQTPFKIKQVICNSPISWSTGRFLHIRI